MTVPEPKDDPISVSAFQNSSRFGGEMKSSAQ